MSTRRSAFTLIELLVVVAIIALLLSILLPSLAGAREQGKRAVCLSNLSNIGKSLWQYANDDSKESAVPISMPMRWKNMMYWLHRNAMWFSWGGKSGDAAYMEGSVKILLDDPNTLPAGFDLKAPIFAASRRPLTINLTGGNITDQDRKKLDMFRCPSDTGYPDDPGVDDIAMENVQRPMYQICGNSYRASLIYSGYFDGSGQVPYQRGFTVGPWGNRISALSDASRLVWLGEPTWFNMIKKDSGTSGNEEDLPGWHKKKLMDQLLFVDGSARYTRAEREIFFESSTLEQMNATNWLARFGDVRLDTYPVGGARIWGDVTDLLSYFQGRWPGRNFSDLYGQKESGEGEGVE